jgi:pantothenate kinase type III
LRTITHGRRKWARTDCWAVLRRAGLFADPTLIVVDFGTATTFDCVQGSAYLGGLICPGVLSSVTALGTQTAKLPQISLELDSEDLDIGTSTRQSLNHGVLFGFAAMLEGLTARLKKRLADPDAPRHRHGRLCAGTLQPSPHASTIWPRTCSCRVFWPHISRNIHSRT